MTAPAPLTRAEGLGAAVLDLAASGERLDHAQVTALYGLPLPEVAAVAHKLRLERRDPGVVTFLIDRNINYTNICYFRCQFCAFSKGKLSENLC